MVKMKEVDQIGLYYYIDISRTICEDQNRRISRIAHPTHYHELVTSTTDRVKHNQLVGDEQTRKKLA